MSRPGKKLRKWRKSRGLSQTKAGDLLLPPVAQGTWAAWENEVKPPDLGNALGLERLTEGHIGAGEWLTVKARQKKARAAESGPSVIDVKDTG